MSVSVTAAVVAALEAGATIALPLVHSYRLDWSGAWLSMVSEEVMLELVAADPQAIDKALSWWVGTSNTWSSTGAPWRRATRRTRRGGRRASPKTTAIIARSRTIRQRAAHDGYAHSCRAGR